MAHKACKGTFFEESFLISKDKEAATVASVSNNTDENNFTEDTTSIHSIRKSSCKLNQYKSSLDDSNCIIGNEIKYEKGRKVSLLSMTLEKHGKENHQAEETLTKLGNIHLQNGTKYKDTAQRILLPKVLLLYLQLFSTINIDIIHFTVHVGKENQYTTTKVLNFSN